VAAFDPVSHETPIDASGLLIKGIESRRQLDHHEAKNVLKAVLRYLADRPTHRQAPFTLEWSLKLHKQMFGQVWKWAGTPRQTELNLGVPAYRIRQDLHQLFEDLPYWRETKSMDLIEQSTRLHHRAVFIHPFLNGNGRWARMLANIYLKRETGHIVLWPDQTIGQTSVIRDQYIACIKAADAGDYDPLISMHREYFEGSSAGGE
jgi:Fic-DOC domain mobile mystery protein B